MTAIFIGNDNLYIEFQFLPKGRFVRIKNIDDIRGRKFTSIVLGYGWWNDKRMEEALNYLKANQPELFRDF